MRDDDITFCFDDCNTNECPRHPSNIKYKDIPHSFAYCKGTKLCPLYVKDIDIPENSCIKCIHRYACQMWNEVNIHTLNITDCVNYEVQNG